MCVSQGGESILKDKERERERERLISWAPEKIIYWRAQEIEVGV